MSLYHLDSKQYKYLLAIKENYNQQLEMYQEKKRIVPNRIVSLRDYFPVYYAVNVSPKQDYATIDQFNFEAFNEGIYLKEQVKNYKKCNGYYPELVQTDEIYMNRENLKFLKERNIWQPVKPLGRNPKEDLSRYQKTN